MNIESLIETYNNFSGEPISPLNLNFATYLDEKDEIKEGKTFFLYPKTESGTKSIYLCGNSLGLQPVALKSQINDQLDKWHEQVF